MRENKIPIDIDLRVESKDFVKDIYFASSKSGKTLEKNLSGAIKTAEDNLKRFAQLRKDILAGSADISQPLYEHAEKLAKLSNQFLTSYNAAQKSGNQKTSKLTEPYKELQDSIRDNEKALAEFSKDLIRTKRDIESWSNVKFYLDNSEEINASLQAEKELNRQIEHTNKTIANRREKIIQSGGNWLDDRYIKGATTTLSKLENQLANLKYTERDVQQLTSGWAKLESQGIEPTAEGLQKLLDKLEVTKSRMKETAEIQKEFKQELSDMAVNPDIGKFEYVGVNSDVAAKLETMATNMRMLGQNAGEANKKVKDTAQSTRQLTSYGRTLLSVLKKVFSHHGRLHKSTSNFFEDTRKGFRHALRNIMRYGLGVRSLYFLFRRLRSAVKESFKVMAQVIPEVNQQISSLVTNFNLMKASLATMVQPLLKWVVPAFQRMAQAAQYAMEWVGKLFATMTGQNYIYRASAAWVDYAESVGKAGKALDNLQKFDELNVIHSEKDSGGGIFSPDTINYEKIDVVEGFFKKFKESWENADFTEIGKTIANKFKSMLLGLGAKLLGIEEFLNKFALSLATGINGLVDRDTGLGAAIGETIAKLIGVGLRSLTLFFGTVNWKDVGAFIASGLNSFVDNINPEDVANFINTLAESFSDFILGAFDELNNDDFWSKVVRKITDIWDQLTAKGKIVLLLPLMFKLGKVLLGFALKTLGTKLAVALGLGAGSASVAGGVLQIAIPLTILLGLRFALDNAYEKHASDAAKKAVEATDKAIQKSGGGPLGAGAAGAGLKLSAIVNTKLAESGSIQKTALTLVDWWNEVVDAWSQMAYPTLPKSVGEIAENSGETFNSEFDKTDIPKKGKTTFSSLVKDIKNLLGIHSPSKVFSDIANNVIDGFLNPFKGFAEKFGKIWNGLVVVVKTPINAIIGIINKFLIACQTMQNAIADAFNTMSFDIPDWVPVIGGEHVGFNVYKWIAPQIPKLARGAVIPPNKQFLAMLGDQKSGTNVEAPLSTIEDAVRNVLSEMQLNLNLNVQGDPSRMFTVMQRESASFSKRTGRPAFT